jgi:hypothetical protein
MTVLRLVSRPSLGVYRAIAEQMKKSSSEGQEKDIQATKVPGVDASFWARQEPGLQFALQAAVNGGSASRTGGGRPPSYSPSSFESVFTGGRTVLFLQALLRTVGSVMIVDEAYGLADKEFEGLVNTLVFWATECKLQWGTVLLGYADQMERFLSTANPGLRRRYDTTIEFGHYTAAELTAIFCARALASDNTTLVALGEEDFVTMARERDDDALRAMAHAMFDEFYRKIAPHGMRGDWTSRNVFGRTIDGVFRGSNAGAAEMLFADAASNQSTRFTGPEGGAAAMMLEEDLSPAPAMYFITPAHVDACISGRLKVSRPYG